MEKKYFLWTLIFISLCVSSCINDDSTLATGDIQAVYIKSPNVRDTLYVGYLDQLSITPTITRGTSHETEGLSFLWEMGDEPGNKPENYITIGKEADLKTIIKNEISTSPYLLRLTVTDTKNNNLKASKIWEVYIQSTFVDGIAVSFTQDDQTSDFSLIMSKDITVNYNKEDKIYHNILRNATGEPCNRLLSQLTFSVYSGTFTSTNTKNELWAVTNNGALYRYNTKDFSLDGTSLEGDVILTYTGNNPKFSHTFVGHSTLFAVSDNATYSLLPGSANTFGWHDATTSQYKIDNNIVIANPTGDNYNVFWLDSNTGHIVALNYSMGTTITYDADLAAKENVFNPNDLTDYTAVAGGFSEDGKSPDFLLKNKITGEYSIYTLTSYQQAVWNDDGTAIVVPERIPSANRKINIPHTGKMLLDKAVSVFFAQNQAILYIVTADGVYGVNFATDTPEVYTTAKYKSAHGEKITKAKLFVQGAYSCYTTSWPEREELPYNSNAIIIATQNGTYDGKITIIPMQQIGTGNLDISKAKTYGGFGRILDFCPTGY